MKYLMDTDHLSIIQRAAGSAYSNLMRRMSQHPISDFAVSIISLHEQVLGSHAYINRARHSEDVVKGYEMMARIQQDFKFLPTLPFDQNSADTFTVLRSQRIQLGTMDLRIASIAISYDLLLLTRNCQDFEKVPGLKFEDWTIGP